MGTSKGSEFDQLLKSGETILMSLNPADKVCPPLPPLSLLLCHVMHLAGHHAIVWMCMGVCVGGSPLLIGHIHHEIAFAHCSSL